MGYGTFALLPGSRRAGWLGMDFDANLSVTDETLWVQAACPEGEDYGTAAMPLHLGRATKNSQLGRELFELLFPPRVLALFERCRGALSDGESVRLRIRVTGEPKDVLRLQAVPWELLHDPRTGRFLALEPEVDLVRYLHAPFSVPDALRLGSEPLDVLIVIAAPRDKTPLSSQIERKAIEEAFADGPVRVRSLLGATRSALGDALRTQPPHVLHFIGHALEPTQSADAALLLEQPDGSSDLVSARDLAQLAVGCPSLRLVVLNSCSTADLGPLEGSRLASSMGPGLALNGVPAVVAMSGLIADDRATEFARVFYQLLSTGASIESSIRAARRALAQGDPGDNAWMLTVLFTRMQRDRPVVVPPVSAASATASLTAGHIQATVFEITALDVERGASSRHTGSASASVKAGNVITQHLSVTGIKTRSNREGSS